jgi:hypothetical protein
VEERVEERVKADCKLTGSDTKTKENFETNKWAIY